MSLKDDPIQIRQVWNDNVESEMKMIREVVDDYPFVGIVCKPVGTLKTNTLHGALRDVKTITEYHYETLKTKVKLLNMIQLGLTLSDKEGNLPTCGSDKYCIWQFNFRECDFNSDILAHDSVELVPQPGIDFAKNNQIGVHLNSFGHLFMSSGIVLNERVFCVTFDGRDDFGYLLKLLTDQNLPETQSEFLNDIVKVYFPNFYDIKHLAKFCNSLHGDLNELAELLEVERVGISHQAGSDSLFTLSTFIKLKDAFFTESIETYSRVLYGLSI